MKPSMNKNNTQKEEKNQSSKKTPAPSKEHENPTVHYTSLINNHEGYTKAKRA